jgi:hypothetical protein
MVTMDELTSFLVWFLFRSFIPTGVLIVCKLIGAFPISWPWALLPSVSAGFFLASYLLAMVLLRTAQAVSRFRS